MDMFNHEDVDEEVLSAFDEDFRFTEEERIEALLLTLEVLARDELFDE